MTLKKIVVATAVAVLFVALSATDALATHFRYGTITTRVPDPAQPRNIEIVVELALRADFMSPVFPPPGTAWNNIGFVTLQGANLSTSFNLNLISQYLNAPEDWFIGKAVIPVTMPANANGVYTVQFNGCCRLSTLVDGNNDRDYILNHTFTATAGAVTNNGPILTGFPIRTLGFNRTTSFALPGVDPDGNPLQWHLSGVESGLVKTQPQAKTLGGANDPSFSLSADGRITWTPTQANCNAPNLPGGTLPTSCMYALQVVASDGHGASTPLDFLIEVVVPTTAPPVLKINNQTTPVTVAGAVGSPITVPLNALEPDSAVVELKAAGSIPAGATLTPSLPQLVGRTIAGNISASSVFAWTPSLGQEGSYVVEFAANDQDGNEVTNSLTINVITSQLRYISGVLRDFAATDPGFNRADGDNTIPLVQSFLDAERKPVFNTAVAGISTTLPGGSGFSNFYRKTPYEVLSFTETNAFQADPTVFNLNATDFHGGDRFFTYEAHTYYVYTPGQQLTFKSSDDMWVFINGRLAVDLGGVHTAARQGVFNGDAFASLGGLVAGGIYPMDIFYAHRGNHTPSISADFPDVPMCSAIGAPAAVTLPNLSGTAATVSGVTRLSSATGIVPSSGAAWTATQQVLAPGFAAEFDFRISPQTAGSGEGFAFVMQNVGATARGGDGGNLGYGGLSNSLAIEFDTHQDVANSDPAFDQVSVHARTTAVNTASEIASLGASLNAADSVRGTPFNINDGVDHHVKITYQPGPQDPSNPAPVLGWLRVYLDNHPGPVADVQIDNQLLQQLFGGTAFVGFTAGAAIGTAATVDIKNFTLAVQQVSGALSNLVSPPSPQLPDTLGSALLQLRDVCNGKLRVGGHAALITATMNVTGGYSTPVSVTDNADGTYRLSYTPRVGGPWQLAVSVGGVSILNSPFIVSVSPATPTVTAADGTFPYSNTARAATGTVNGVFNEPLSPPLTFTYNGQPSAIEGGGYNVVANFAGNVNYAPGSATATLTITPVAPTVTVNSASVVYNGQARSVTGDVIGVDGTSVGTPDLTYTPGNPSNVGTYAVLGSFAGNNNYTPATGSGSLTIDPAAPSVTVTDVAATFDGGPHPATVIVSGINGDVPGIAAVTYNGDSAMPVNAGTYAVAATFEATGNYAAASGSGIVSIAKATPSVEVTPATVTYDANPHAVTATAKGINGVVLGTPQSITYDGSAIAPTDVGTYAVVAAFDETQNYVASTGQGTLTIAAAAPIVTVPNVSVAYDGNAHAAGGSVIGAGGQVLGPLTFTYNGDSAPPVNAGSYHVVGSFSGGGNYASASGEATLTISAAAPTVTVNNASVVYDGLPHAVTATAHGLNGEVLGPVTLTYDNSAANPVDAKSYHVVATLAANGNYAGATGEGTLDITRATPIVTAIGGTFTYNGQPHAASASVTGVNGVNLGTAQSILYNGSSIAPKNAGNYGVVATFNQTTNYEGASASATLLINRAPLMITADSLTMAERTAVPPLTATYTGFVNGETAAVLDVPVTLTTTATSTSAPGAYPITASGAADANYSISYTPGVLTIGAITPGLMTGHGFVRDADNKYDFDFIVRERATGADRGNLELRIKGEGKHTKGKPRDDRFVSRTLTNVVFSDDPTSRPGRRPVPQVDTVLFEGTGEWNGRNGYRFEAFAQDLGEPGRHRESVRIRILDASGRVVAFVEGDLDGGNVQSVRIRH